MRVPSRLYAAFLAVPFLLEETDLAPQLGEFAPLAGCQPVAGARVALRLTHPTAQGRFGDAAVASDRSDGLIATLDKADGFGFEGGGMGARVFGIGTPRDVLACKAALSTNPT